MHIGTVRDGRDELVVCSQLTTFSRERESERKRWKGNECDTIFVCQIMRCRNKSSGREMWLDCARTKKNAVLSWKYVEVSLLIIIDTQDAMGGQTINWCARRVLDLQDEGGRGDPEKTSNCQLHRQSGYFVPRSVVPFSSISSARADLMSIIRSSEANCITHHIPFAVD